MRVWKYALVFVLLSAADAVTTWLGVRLGFVESNPLLARKLSEPLLFFGSYAFYTGLGVLIIALSLRLSRAFPAFRAIPFVLIVFKALPVINNVLLLSGVSGGILATVTRPLLEKLFMVG
ncbi:DUF5658 family protein [Thermococcus sp.]|jgi:hypothetical protein|uniref:DUF5658 family protein n=1 Tax=Thermococcus sp. TaxID=35749 RepID=UPI002621D79B|nr:DUF5658 family protein [Thermococcus sp.]